jgi:ribosomal protein S8
MPNRNNFFGNACMFFGSLQRGLILRHPHVTFPLSRVGLHMAKLLANIGVIDSYRVVQNHGRIKQSSYVRLPEGGADVTSTSDLFRCPHLYLHLTFTQEPFRPLVAPPSGNALHSPIPYHDKLPTSVSIISKPTRKVSHTARELAALKARYGPGILLLSTRRGVITDVEADAYGMGGGIPLGHIGLPLGHVAKLRAIVRMKQAEEAAAEEAAGQAKQQQQQQQQQYVSLADWPVRQMMARAAEQRELALQQRQQEQLPLVEALAAARRAEQVEVVADASEAIAELKKQLIAAQTEERLQHGGPQGRDMRPDIRREPRQYLHRDEQAPEVLEEFRATEQRYRGAQQRREQRRGGGGGGGAQHERRQGR